MAIDWLSLASGLYGLYQGNKQQNMGKDAIKATDPFGPFRALYGGQLLKLMGDPSSIEDDPGYQFQFDQGQKAIGRKLGSMGYNGSGNYDIEMVKYGTGFASEWYDKRIAQLAQLAGAGIQANPGAGLAAYGQGVDTQGESLASIGYGLTKSGNIVEEIEKLFGGGGYTTGDFGTGSALNEAWNQRWETGGGVKPLPNTAGGEAAGAAGAAGGTAGKGILTGGGEYGFSSGSLADGVGVGDIAGLYGAYDTLVNPKGKFAGTISGASSGMSLAGWPGAIVGGIIGYARNGGIPDMNPWDASGFSGITMDKAWEDQNLARLASNPAASLASKFGVKSESFVGKLLDPSGFFSKHGDEKRNMKAFLAQYPNLQSTTVGGKEYIMMPDNVFVPKDNFQKFAGTWYGATFAPDGDQEGWQSKYNQMLTEYKRG